MRAYAERRGLVPASEIVLRERRVATEPVVSARSRRRLFDGLKLDTSLAASDVSVRLGRSVGIYARAWADADRMREAGLPVLPH